MTGSETPQPEHKPCQPQSFLASCVSLFTSRQSKNRTEEATDPMDEQQQEKSPMVLIPPPPSVEESSSLAAANDNADAAALECVHRLGKILGTRSTRLFMQDWMKNNVDESVRRIQGERYELFVHNASNKGSACLDEILRRHDLDAETTKNTLVDYAKRQALKDGRLSSSGSEYKFGNFSVISTFGKVLAQAPHIDLLEPQYQFGLLLSDKGPGTLAYKVDAAIASVEDVAVMFQRLIGKEMPTNLVRAFQQSNDAMRLLKAFGNVLVPESEMKEVKVGDSPLLSQGALLSLPGSVIHAGPATTSGFRAVLFFTACPKEHEATEYHPDTQYTGNFLCGELLRILWRAPGVSLEERQYLVDMLLYYIHHAAVKRYWAGHFPVGKFRSFMAVLERKSLKQSELKREVEKAVRDEDLCFFNVIGDFDVVSVKGLFTTFNGEDTEIIIHKRRIDGRVLIEYPNEVTKDLFSWEGSKPSDFYRLEMHQENAMFDGANGKLTDTDGEEVMCFLPAASIRQGRSPATESMDGHSMTRKSKRIRKN